MQRASEKPAGSITIFVSLVMISIFSFLFVLVESARTAGARWYLRTAVSSAMDSVFSQYHRKLWDEYRVLFAEFETEDELAEDFEKYLMEYTSVENWYPMEIAGVQTETVNRATDGDGIYLEQEILDYMAYGVWNLDFDESTVQELWDSGTEAVAVTDISTLYRGHSEEALALEESLEEISSCLTKQKEYKDRGQSELSSYDCDGFLRVAEKLIRELERIPDLVENYRDKADTLAEGLSESRIQAEQARSDCSADVDNMLQQEMEEYESYVSADGERRQEIEALTDQSREQIRLVREVMDEARDAQQEVDDYEEDDDEDDGPDLAAIWKPVQRHFSRLSISALSFVHGVADKEKEGWLKQITAIYEAGILNLVIPDGMTVSGKSVDLSEAPTASWENGENRSVRFTDRLLIDEYGGRFFRNFRDTAQKESDADSTDETAGMVLAYEVEYLLNGSDTDQENLANAVSRLLAVREGLNLIHILTNSEKRAQARTLAMAITGLMSATPLLLVTTFFVMSVWALAESMADIKGLLAGNQVPLLKSSGDWCLDTEALLAIGRDRTIPEGGGESGLGYLSWLKILLFMDDTVRQEYRMMDLMQMNLRLLQDGFRMKYGVCRAGVRAQIYAKHVFFSPGFVDRAVGGGEHTYSVEISAERSYSK